MKSIRIEGPYSGSYSLAQINRNLIVEFSKIGGYNVFFSATASENYSRDLDAENSLSQYAIYSDVRDGFRPDIVIRHTWPIESSDLKGFCCCRIFPWEESLIPQEIINQFNENYNIILAPSDFVLKVLKANNARNVFRMYNSYCLSQTTTRLKKTSDVVYTHISSCFLRKSPEVLISAYCNAFANLNDTKLIIKTGYNPHVDVLNIINQNRDLYGSIADTIVYIDNDFTSSEMNSLLDLSHFGVYPSRGEGFGLPIIECHRAKVPVIVSDCTALSELIVDDVDYRIKCSAQYSLAHTSIPGSIWWEPDFFHLKNAYQSSRNEYINEYSKYKERTDRLEGFYWPSWAESVSKIDVLLKEKSEIINISSAINKRIAFVSTYNIKCGIAEYTKNVIDCFDKDFSIKVVAQLESDCNYCSDFEVIHSWVPWCHNVYSNIKQAIIDADVVCLQHHSAFYSVQIIEKLIQYCIDNGKKIVIEFHSALDGNNKELNYIGLVNLFSNNSSVLFIAHSLREILYLNPTFAIDSNVRLVAHPFYTSDNYCELRTANNSYIITAFGFLRKHKRFDRLLNALNILKKSNFEVNLVMLSSLTPSADSAETYHKLEDLIKDYDLQSNVYIETNYLEPSAIKAVIGYSDCVVFPYEDVPEGASGAVRMALAAGAAVVCSHSASMFDEFTDSIVRFDSDYELADCIKKIITNREYREVLRKKSKEINNKWSFNDYSNYLKNWINC